jgi:DNA polymerase III sliding clamp (beta) subunit (PCNA family)
MFDCNFDTFVETKNLKTALNKARKQMEKLNFDPCWLDLDITKENENLFQYQEDNYRLRIETYGEESNQKCFYIDVAYNNF